VHTVFTDRLMRLVIGNVYGLLVRHSMLGPVGTPSELETPDKSRWFTPRYWTFL